MCGLPLVSASPREAGGKLGGSCTAQALQARCSSPAPLGPPVSLMKSHGRSRTQGQSIATGQRCVLIVLLFPVGLSHEWDQIFSVSSSVCLSASDISASEDKLGKRISPMASQNILLLVSTILFQFLPFNFLHHDQQMVWFNYLIPFDDAKNQTKPLTAGLDVPFRVLCEFLFGPLYFWIVLDTPCLPCSVLSSMSIAPEYLIVYIWTSGPFDSSKYWPWPSNNEIFYGS